MWFNYDFRRKNFARKKLRQTILFSFFFFDLIIIATAITKAVLLQNN